MPRWTQYLQPAAAGLTLGVIGAAGVPQVMGAGYEAIDQAMHGNFTWQFLALLAVHFWWRSRGFGGDQLFLPAIALLTGIGFILMLFPIATLDNFDPTSMKSSMRVMSGGMAVAMYTTLAGLVGSILVKAQYYILDNASAYLFDLITDLTEVFVVSALERQIDGRQVDGRV